MAVPGEGASLRTTVLAGFARQGVCTVCLRKSEGAPFRRGACNALIRPFQWLA